VSGYVVLAGRPVTSARAPGPLAVRGTPAELTTGFSYDSGSYTRGTVAYTVPQVPEGLHTIEVHASDTFGNIAVKTFVIDVHKPFRKFLQGLFSNAQALFHLLHSNMIAVQIISICTQWHLEIQPIVNKVWLVLANIVIHPSGAEHGAGEAIGNCIFFGNDTHSLQAIHENPITA